MFIINIFNATITFCTWYLRKRCLISICWVLECMTGFLDRLVALMLSHFRGMWSRVILKSSSCCFIQRLWAQQLLAAIYYAFVVNNATLTCFLQFQDTRELPKRWHVPLVLFLSTLHPAKLESEKPIKFKEVPLDTTNQHWLCPWYLIFILTTIKWDSLEFSLYLAHKQTLSIIPSQLAIK